MYIIILRTVTAILLCSLLSSCTVPGATPPPSAALHANLTQNSQPGVPATAILSPTSISIPTGQPRRVPSATLPEPASASATPPPTSTPQPAPTTAPPAPVIDLSAQTAALLPEFAPDLDNAANWDHYRISATLNPTSLTISGTQTVAVRNQASVPFESLYFHLYPNHPDFGGSLNVEAVQVNAQPVATGTEQDGLLLRVALLQPLAPGEQAIVTMNFQARTPRNASGSTYGAFNQEAGVWSLASFYPVLARYLADGWDRRPVSSQGDLAVTTTALYDVTLDTPADWNLVTTGTRIEVGDPADPTIPAGYRRERFVSGPQRDFFLAATNGLDQASSAVDGTRITVYYQRGDTGAGQRSLVIAEQSLRAFNARYGRYPLREMDIVQAALTNFLGVEYPGIMLIEQNLYRNNGRSLETTIAHEIAHQWWYSQVGNDYQGEPWLDEGLASFSQIVYYEFLGDAASAEGELQFFRSVYQDARNTGRDGVVNRPTGTFRGNYVALVYAKSALFFQALRQHMGDETFFAFLQNYYTSYRYREASGPDLLAVAQATCTCDLQPLYDAWINGDGPVEVP